jgi:tetratricopeptide (TPR) repeat protein
LTVTVLAVAHQVYAQATFVKAASAHVYDAPDATSRTVGDLAAMQVVELLFPERGTPVDWQRIEVRTVPGGPIMRGWARASDLWLLEGMRLGFWTDRHQEAARALLTEASGTSEPTIAAWLRLCAAREQALIRQFDAAVATLDGVARAGGRFAPVAYLAAARIRNEHDNLPGVIRTYEAMLAAFPDYQLNVAQCAADVMARFIDVCDGEPSIEKRLEAVRLFKGQRPVLEREIADTSRPAVDRAASAVRLANAWQAKASVDPGPNPETFQVRSPAARRLYERAVQLAPGSTPAGDAAWKLIWFTEPYEWEGDIDGQYAWTLAQFRPFVAAYPRHEYAGDALFNIALAAWAHGGYPEVLSIVGGPDYGPAKIRALEPWFVTGGFGGGPGVTFPPPDQHQARAALTMFQQIVNAYPTSASVPMASYYVAVIYDYCLGDKAHAIPAFEAFLAAHADSPYAAKAGARLAALRGER